MNLSDREKRLLKLLGILLVPSLIVIWLLLAQDPLGSSSTASRSTEDLQSEREKFESYTRTLRRYDEIIERQEKISNFLPTSLVGIEAENKLSGEIATIYARHNISKPDVEPPRTQRIPGIVDYKFLEIKTRFAGSYDKVCNMLYDFYRQGYIIDDLSISGTLDKDWCQVKQLTLMKLVKTSDYEKERFKLMDERRGVPSRSGRSGV